MDCGGVDICRRLRYNVIVCKYMNSDLRLGILLLMGQKVCLK